jgi:asparagine synthase (glutamine-hydrolysing)
MCGIAGIVNVSSPLGQHPDTVRCMIDSIAYRGPNGRGIYIDDHAHLGHVRLSIIDLSAGTQPMGSADDRYWIVYNGEVYNYVELRSFLEGKGHRFTTKSDTEVVLNGYREWGPHCCEHFNGQWAFAIWDRVDRTLFLSRDRVGVRPLFFARSNGLFLFASEMKALFASRLIEPRIDEKGIDQVFTFWTTAPGHTVFSGVEQLAPGSWALLSETGFVQQAYWDIPLYEPAEQLRWTEPVWVDTISSVLDDAVAIRLRADVEVGAYLSGGLDSSLTTFFARRHAPRRLTTFGIRFDDPAFDEGSFQKLLVDHLQVDHHEAPVTADDIDGMLSDVVWHCEQPLLRSAPAPMLALSRRVRDANIRVVLSGEGADEFFCGYDLFKEMKLRAFCARFPQSRLRPLLYKRLYPEQFSSESTRRALPLFFSQSGVDTNHPLASHRTRFAVASRIKQFYSADFADRLKGYSATDELLGTLPERFFRLDNIVRAQYLEIVLLMSNYLLSSQGDRMAMASGIETRMPFLDPRIMELAGRMPLRLKLKGLTEKNILRECAAPYLPPEIVRRRKYPYRAPMTTRAITKQSSIIEEMLSATGTRQTGIFDPAKVSRIAARARETGTSSEFESMALVAIVSTHLLVHQFVRAFTPRIGPVDSLVFIDKTTPQQSSSTIR